MWIDYIGTKTNHADGYINLSKLSSLIAVKIVIEKALEK